MGLSRILAELAVATESSSISTDAINAAKKTILDTLGVMIAGSKAPGVKPVVDQMCDWGGKAEASVLVHGMRLPSPNAAFANGAMIHSLDYDDAHVASALHIMSIVLPAALAIGEKESASGRALLDSVVLGVEVATRLGRAYNRRRTGYQGRGFLPSSVVGGFGATAAAGRLFGMTVEQTVHAMGVNYAQASGNRQALFDKTLTKRLQPAFAARSAVWATVLAKSGITGPHNAIEGDAGLFRVYLNAEPPEAEELAPARRAYEIERVTVKRFSSCGAAHAVTQAALELVNQHDLKPEDIRDVEIYLGEGPNTLVGAPFEVGDNPQVNAQFSAAYGVAVALLRRCAGLSEFTDACVRKDTQVAALARRARFLTHLDDPPETKPIDDDWPDHVDWPHVVLVKTATGQTLQQHCTLRQVLEPSDTTFDDVIAKFRECTAFSGICSARKADGIISSVENLDTSESVSSLIETTLLSV